MTSDGINWSASTAADIDRESRIRLALLRGVMDNLRPNRRTIPLVALAVAIAFLPWVSPWMLAAWFAQVMLGLVPQFVLFRYFPAGEMTTAQLNRWVWLTSAANVFFVANWTSLGWYMWVPGIEVNHILIMVVLSSTLAAHGTLVGACRRIAIPAFTVYGLSLALVPLQAMGTSSIYLSLVTPVFTWYVAHIAKQNYIRARNAVIMVAERNALMAELVMSKIDSDRGRDKAEAASLAKSQFLANMSHELRTPLNAILGFSEMISSRMFQDKPERNYEYAGLIHGSGKHLLALINDILDLAKIEAGRWQLEEAELDLHRVADDAMQFVEWRSRESEAVLVNVIPPDLERIYADERAIKQILLNLLSNAVKFTPAQGRVTVFAHRDPEGGMVLGVSDTGIGIAEQDRQRVFDSFGQGRHDVALSDKGTGLGLAIVKGLTESHGGYVSLESEVNCGTTVTLHLPAARVLPHNANGQGDLAHFVA